MIDTLAGHYGAQVAFAIAIAGVAYLIIAWPVWKIRHTRRTRQRYGNGGK